MLFQFDALAPTIASLESERASLALQLALFNILLALRTPDLSRSVELARAARESISSESIKSSLTAAVGKQMQTLREADTFSLSWQQALFEEMILNVIYTDKPETATSAGAEDSLFGHYTKLYKALLLCICEKFPALALHDAAFQKFVDDFLRLTPSSSPRHILTVGPASAVKADTDRNRSYRLKALILSYYLELLSDKNAAAMSAFMLKLLADGSAASASSSTAAPPKPPVKPMRVRRSTPAPKPRAKAGIIDEYNPAVILDLKPTQPSSWWLLRDTPTSSPTTMSSSDGAGIGSPESAAAFASAGSGAKLPSVARVFAGAGAGDKRGRDEAEMRDSDAQAPAGKHGKR